MRRDKRRKSVPPGPPPILVATAAAKSYGDLVALGPLDLAIRAGERVALVGHNGSGKSTFLGIAAGLLELSDGVDRGRGCARRHVNARASRQYIPDDPVLYDDLSVREHLRVRRGAPRSRGRRRPSTSCSPGSACCTAPTTCRLVQPGPAAEDVDRRSASSGRLDVLLVDEPFVGLDAPGKQALLALLDQAHPTAPP